MTTRILKRQFKLMKNAQKHLETITTLTDSSTIRYDYNMVVDSNGLFKMSYEDINTLMFLLLFNEHKHVIYDKMTITMLDFFFPHHHSEKSTYNKLFSIFKTLKKTSLNMNKFLSILIKNKRDFYYRYTLNTFVLVIDVITTKLDYYTNIQKKYNEAELQIDHLTEIKLEKLKNTIKQYEFLSTLMTNIINDQESFIRTCDFILDYFIKQNIKLYSIIPYNIYFGIIKMYAHKPNTRTGQNDGQLIEQEFAKIAKNGTEFESVVKSNIELFINQSDRTGKKGEFDIIIGTMNKQRDLFKINSVYDIKRSARLIPDDVDKFNTALADKRITLKMDSLTKAKKFKSYKKGYIYINDWDVTIETTYKIRDILISMITKNAQHSGFFTDFCNMIKYEGDHVYLKLNSILSATLSEMIDNENTTIKQKLKGFEIRKFVSNELI